MPDSKSKLSKSKSNTSKKASQKKTEKEKASPKKSKPEDEVILIKEVYSEENENLEDPDRYTNILTSEVNRSELLAAVKAIQPLTDSREVQIYRSAIEIYSTGNYIELRASDGESEALVRIRRSGTHKLNTLVSAKTLSKSIGAFSDKKIQIGFQKDTSELILRKTDETRKLGLKAIDNTRLPDPIKLDSQTKLTEVSASECSAALLKAIKIAGAKGSRPVLETVALSSLSFLGKNHLNILATDGHRLIEIPVETEEKIFLTKPFLWPLGSIKAAALEMSRASKEDPLLKVKVVEYDGGAELLFKERSWKTVGTNGTYPDTKKLFKAARGENLLYFKKEEMLDCLKALSAVSVGNTPVLLELGNSQKINIKYKVPGVTSFEEKLSESTYHGEPHNLAFNHEYLSEACKILEGGNYDDQGILEPESSEEHQDKIKARLPGNANAVLFYGANYTRILLMPVRV